MLCFLLSQALLPKLTEHITLRPHVATMLVTAPHLDIIDLELRLRQ